MNFMDAPWQRTAQLLQPVIQKVRLILSIRFLVLYVGLQVREVSPPVPRRALATQL
jgi:hypothetical protein